jgi:hypothetical protein
MATSKLVLLLNFAVTIIYAMEPDPNFVDELQHRVRSYNPYRPPDPPEGETNVTLTCNLRLLGFDSFDESLNYFEIQVRTECRWFDNRLDYDFYLKRNIDPFIPRVNQSKFWVPYLIFQPIREAFRYDDHMRYPWLTIWTKERLSDFWEYYSLKIFCHIKLTKYPMDVQFCRVKFRPFQPEEFNIRLNPVWGNLTDGNLNSNVRMEVFSFYLTSLTPWLDDSGKRPYLVLDFIFTRRILPKMVTLYVPSFLIVSASFVSFWIEPAAVPARVALLITNVLSLIQLLLYARKELPPVSSVTAMDVWFFFMMIFLWAVMTEFVFAYQAFLVGKKKYEMNERKPNLDVKESLKNKKIPWTIVSLDVQGNKTFKTIFPKKEERIGIQNELKKKYDYHNMVNVSLVTSKIREWILQEKMDTVSKVAFPIALVLFTVLYFVIYLNV